MAGFEWEFACPDRDREIGAKALNYVRSIAKQHGVATVYRFRRNAGFRGTADGSLFSLQALVSVLIETLPAFIAGHKAAAGHNRSVYVVYGFIMAYMEGLKGNQEAVEEAATQLGGVPTSIVFRVGTATHLAGAAKRLSSAFVSLHIGRMSEETLIEECHTFLGRALTSALQASNSATFSSMVHQGFDRRIYPAEIRDTLLRLNQLRRLSKHRGQSLGARVDVRFYATLIAAAHMILRRLA